MAQSDTVDRILDAAEELFAERGFSETSLRMITSKANVNLAAVNYHFGSKNALIHSVFARFLTPFTQALEAQLEAREQSHGGTPLQVEEILAIMTHCIISIPARRDNGLSIFMRLLGMAYTQYQGHLRKYLENEYSYVFKRVMGLWKEATPSLSTVDRFWRIQFMLGATAFTLSSFDALRDILQNDLGVESRIEEVMQRLAPFLAAGMNQGQAPTGSTPAL